MINVFLSLLAIQEDYKSPCNPSPCGPYSECRDTNRQAVCSCLMVYIGSPPYCHPECIISADCSLRKACIDNKCTDPCPGACGLNSNCHVNNHSPICSCQSEYTGDPFHRCYIIPRKICWFSIYYSHIFNYHDFNHLYLAAKDEPITPVKPTNPCIPSPCGPNAQCQAFSDVPSCDCLPSYYGSPPNCHPECTINADCPTNKACIRNKCGDPCPGSCGFNAVCQVINHNPICSCVDRYSGDPFSSCRPIPQHEPSVPPPQDKCNSSPCGPNAQCNDGTCTCLPEYQGNPYIGCRPECLTNTDCPRSKACLHRKCTDPCPGTCALNAVCDVINHVPMCSCAVGMEGNAFIQCTPQTCNLL